MKLLGNTKIEITKDENGENVPYLEINEVELIFAMFLIIVIKNLQSLVYICS